MKPNPNTAPATPRKPRFALAIATVFGIGYVPKAAGTFGSLVGCLFTLGSVSLCLPVIPTLTSLRIPMRWLNSAAQWANNMATYGMTSDFWGCLLPSALGFLLVSFAGVSCASCAAAYAGIRDPQNVVIDEVSGQHLTLLLGLAPSIYPRWVTANPDFVGHGFLFTQRLLNWKYLLLGFILFRVFDIWKPFPVRQAEKLPGGWGIMADDWVAAVYAALGLWVARYLGL